MKIRHYVVERIREFRVCDEVVIATSPRHAIQQYEREWPYERHVSIGRIRSCDERENAFWEVFTCNYDQDTGSWNQTGKSRYYIEKQPTNRLNDDGRQKHW